jgi:hypothetical protein
MMTESVDESSPREAHVSPAEATGKQKSITDFFKKASKGVAVVSAYPAEDLQPSPESVASEAEDETAVSSVTKNTEPAETSNTTQEVLTDSTPEESSTPQSLESANQPEPAPTAEEVPTLKPAKKARKNRTNAQRRAAKERAKAAALEPSVRIRGMDVDAVCLAWVVVAMFVVCTAAGVAGWFI